MAKGKKDDDDVCKFSNYSFLSTYMLYIDTYLIIQILSSNLGFFSYFTDLPRSPESFENLTFYISFR